MNFASHFAFNIFRKNLFSSSTLILASFFLLSSSVLFFEPNPARSKKYDGQCLISHHYKNKNIFHSNAFEGSTPCSALFASASPDAVGFQNAMPCFVVASNYRHALACHNF